MEFSDQCLTELRRVGDPELDRLMEALAREGHLDEVNRVILMPIPVEK